MFVRSLALIALVATTGVAQKENWPEPIVSIRLQEQASALGASVQLRDIAVVESSFAPLKAKLEVLSLGNRPEAGFRRLFDRARILQVLRDEGLQPDLVAWTGSSRCIVDAPMAPLEADRILESAEPAALAALRSLGIHNPELEPLAVAQNIYTAPGRSGRRLHARAVPGSDQQSLLTVLVEVVVDGEIDRTLEQQFRVFRSRPVLVPTRPIERGEALHSGLFSIDNLRVGLGDRTPFITPGSVEGKVAARALIGGRPLQQVDVRMPYLVRRNQPVKIIEKRGGIELTMNGTATIDGALGDAMTVRKSDGGMLRVYVAGRGLVSTRPIPLEELGANGVVSRVETGGEAR